MKTVFVHPERCIGCKQCETACAVAHSTSQNLFWAVFESPPPKPRIHAAPGLTMNTAFPNKCRHCDPAPCMYACPTAAIHRAEDYSDTVLIDAKKCIACGMCAMVCPFDVITYFASADAPHKSVVATKCDQCIERRRDGQAPACIDVCKVNALEFGEINDLIRESRTRYSEAVSAAIGQPAAEFPALPSAIESWRAWGASVTSINADHHEKGE